ncbi:serine-threonine/tyrosine-protein kinase catalytic domain-containing protein [Tanacetum coccineum]
MHSSITYLFLPLKKHILKTSFQPILVNAAAAIRLTYIGKLLLEFRLLLPDVATEKFKTRIGGGGYGVVYKGVLSIDGKDTAVAVKRLNEQFGQGLKVFLTEIRLLFGQEHPNLISLLGYCDDENEKIIVYEYAARGSLDRYIRRNNRDKSSITLTWLERLKICADVARGLDHLHNHLGGHRMIIHRDIKSSNILIDENWVAKISDLGLSKLGVTGLGMSDIVTNGCGTHGYIEPEYHTSAVVTKKSDVYSFGIVLFEVLCGRLCIIEPDNGFILSGESVKEYYNKGDVIKIIDPSLREHMGSYSMTKFSEIAYRCLHDDREQRPAMDIVAKELEETLNVHGHFRISFVVASDIVHQNICTSIQKQMAATSKATMEF